jgi:hypothetical protein
MRWVDCEFDLGTKLNKLNLGLPKFQDIQENLKKKFR